MRARGTCGRLFRVACGMLLLVGAASAERVAPGEGLTIEQLSFQFGPQIFMNTDWGRYTAHPDQLHESTGLWRGYINIWCNAGWIVQNLFVDLSDGPEPVVAHGRMGIDQPPFLATLFNAHVEFTPEPMANFQGGQQNQFPVTPYFEDARGASTDELIVIGLPPNPNLSFFANEQNFSYMQPLPTNVESALNQCVPMSMANSLQYLEDRYGLAVPHDHKAGLKGDNSLVGQLDQEMGRGVTSRRAGTGMWFQPALAGKFSYLSKNGLGDQVVHSHQGRGWGALNLNRSLPDGNLQGSGIITEDEGAVVTWEWICGEVREGNDVEVIFSYDDNMGNPTGGHAVRVVGCGMTLGRPWIKYLHDGNQSDDTKGLEVVQVYMSDLDGDGMVNFGSAGRETRLAISESVTAERKSSDQAPPVVLREGFVNGASFFFTAAPGSIASFFGGNVGLDGSPAELRLTGPAPAQAEGLPTTLNGTQVWVNGIAAPLFYAGPKQVNFQVPSDTLAGEASVVVTVENKPSLTVSVPISTVGPGIFPLDVRVAGEGRGVIQNQDFSLNLPENPATPGEAVVVYMTGLGPVDNPVPDGQPTPLSPLAWALADVQATVGGEPAKVVFAGLTPEYVGLAQVNVEVPALPAGDHTLVVQVDGVASNEVLLAVNPE